MATKGRTKGDKFVTKLQFVMAYKEAKSLAELQKALKGITEKTWTPKMIDQKIAQLRNDKVQMKTLFQRGWVAAKENQRVAVVDLNALLADSDILASPEQMPKPKKKPVAEATA